jgi:hypothetical protein
MTMLCCCDVPGPLPLLVLVGAHVAAGATYNVQLGHAMWRAAAVRADVVAWLTAGTSWRWPRFSQRMDLTSTSGYFRQTSSCQ